MEAVRVLQTTLRVTKPWWESKGQVLMKSTILKAILTAIRESASVTVQ